MTFWQCLQFILCLVILASFIIKCVKLRWLRPPWMLFDPGYCAWQCTIQFCKIPRQVSYVVSRALDENSQSSTTKLKPRSKKSIHTLTLSSLKTLQLLAFWYYFNSRAAAYKMVAIRNKGQNVADCPSLTLILLIYYLPFFFSVILPMLPSKFMLSRF